MRYRTLIVDDEPLARERLRTLLEQDPEIQIVGECANGRSAVAAVVKHSPDLMFLDVHMPEVDGFTVIEAIGPGAVPAVVFVTAYDRYALKAFEAHALDYLLKPFDRARFEKTLARAKRQLEGGTNQRLADLLRATQPQRFVIKNAGRITFLKVEEVDWIEAEGNYVRLHSGSESHLLRETMNSMETRLNSRQFIRIHRSRIVNIDSIKELKPWFRGEYVVIMRSGEKLTLTRSYRDRLQQFVTGKTG
jgi:two-component system LytT family response regulator